jgi:hypothetical protein
MSRSCPGCGLSLADDAFFCPTCGWHMTTAFTYDTPTPAAIAPARTPAAPVLAWPTAAVTPAAAAPLETGPLTPGETLDPDPGSAPPTVRRVLALGLLPAVVIVECTAWYLAMPHIYRATHHILGYRLLLQMQGFLLFVCTLGSLTVTAWLCPAVGKEYTAWFDSRYLAAPREDNASVPGKMVVQAVFIAVWLAIILVVTRLSR